VEVNNGNAFKLLYFSYFFLYKLYCYKNTISFNLSEKYYSPVDKKCLERCQKTNNPVALAVFNVKQIIYFSCPKNNSDFLLRVKSENNVDNTLYL